MVLNEIKTIFVDLWLNSPLDQFGDDDDDFTIFSILPLPYIVEEILMFFAIDEVLDLNEIIALSLANAGLFLFDDEDTDMSDWEENDLTSSSTHSVIFTSNIFGMIPGVETVTSDASLTFFLSISTMLIIILFGFSLHNIRFFSIFYPTGTPTVMAPFIILIEFISYVARAVILGMRLFANMFAGHSLVKILMSFAWIFLNSALPFLSFPVFILLILIFFMEMGIAYLQAYVFNALAGMYLEDAVLLGH
jgi:ATP synthase subunit 6